MSITGTSYASTRVYMDAQDIVCDDALADFTVTEYGYKLTGLYVGCGEMDRAECIRFFGAAEVARVEGCDVVREALDQQIKEGASSYRMEAAE